MKDRFISLTYSTFTDAAIMAQIFYMTEQLQLTLVTLAYNAAIFLRNFYIGNRVLKTLMIFANELLAEIVRISYNMVRYFYIK